MIVGRRGALVLGALLALSALSTSLWSSSADAHTGGADGVVPFFDDTGALVGAGTTFGLVFSDGDTLAQTCDEAIGQTIPTAFVQEGQATLSANGEGVFVTVDNGCTWAPIAGLDGRQVQVLTPSPTQAGRVWTMSADAAGANVIAVVSLDSAGATADIVVSVADARFTSAAVIDDDGDDVVIIAATVAGAPALLLLRDETLLTLESSALAEAQIVRVLEVGDGVLSFSTLDRLGRGHLFVAAVSDVINAAAADVSATEIGSFDGLVTATARFREKRFVTSGGGIVHNADVAVDGSVGAFTRLPMAPLRCLQVHDQVLIGCSQNADSWFVSSNDGVSFAPLLPRADVVDFACAEGSVAADACAYRFAVDPVDPVDDDDDTDDDDDVASCASAADVSSVAAFAIVAVVGRRRRRP